MKYIQLGFAALLLFAFLLPIHRATAQNLELSSDSRMWIEGTSNRDDWTVHAKEMSARAAVADGDVAPSSLAVTVTAKQIKSDESTIMDRLMHESLKVSEHPTITYDLLDARPSGDNEAILTATGRLTLAGVTREIEMDVESERLDDGSVRFKGMTPLKLTDFDLQPPTAMFGALRTGNEVTVHFDVTFVPAG